MVDLPSETYDQPELSPEAGEAQKVNLLARKGVGRCGGLPLSILRLGYLFSGTKNVTYEELLKALDHIDHSQTPWLEIMGFNVKDLLPHLRQCLSYFGLFPKDSETSARRLVALWVAEGWTSLEKIPPSIGNITNLQTLDVKHTYIRILPSSIWKLKKLRHLCMNQIYRSQIKHQPSGSSLQNLHTLRGAFIDKDSPLKDGLRRLTNLRKLALAFQLNLSQQIALAESLLKLKQLKTLKLKSIDEMSRPQDLKATFLLGLENLSNLYLFGKLENTSINRLPQSLTDLTLSASGLLDDPMPDMSCSKGGFPLLHVLNFWMLEELEEWNVVEEAMPNLKKLEIRSCNSLKVPTGLGHLKTLSELKLKDMPVKFTAEIEETKEIIWGDIALSPAIIIDDHSQY
nr:disease resistance protein RPP8-like [Quercus suber]